MILDIYVTILLFIIGAVFGSFLNALAERIFAGENFVSGRSVCRSCSHTIPSYDLIPVCSFIILRGKCRYCKAPIPADLFISEVLLGIFFALAYIAALPLLFTDMSMFLLYLGFLLGNVSVFFYIALYDFKYYLIPDFPLHFLTIFYIVLFVGIFLLSKIGIPILYYDNYNTFLFQHLITGVLLFIFFLSIYFFTKGRGIGGGDVKLSFVIGLLLGAKPTIVFLYVAFFSGAIISVFLLLLHSKKIKDSIPFGPFLSFGVIIALLFANGILHLPFFSFLDYLGVLL